MKRLILGAVITGALGTAGATQWEYASLTIGKYLPAEARLNDEYLYEPYYALWQAKGSISAFTEGISVQSFYFDLFKNNIKKDAGFLESMEFQNMVGSLGWEMVGSNKLSDTAVLKGQKVYAIVTNFYYKRPVQ